MLSLQDPVWRTLEGGYRMPYDASVPLARMERGESPWGELWNELHHQGDVGLASYAAVPQLVRIADMRAQIGRNLFALAATIEVERHRKTNPSLPDWLVTEYQEAWDRLVELALQACAAPLDSTTLRGALSVIALGRGDLQLGALLNHSDTSEVVEYVEEHLAWSELYA